MGGGLRVYLTTDYTDFTDEDKHSHSVILSRAKDPRERTDVGRPLGSFAALRMTGVIVLPVFIRVIRVIRG